jgi:phosphate transport system substrate-binding protein
MTISDLSYPGSRKLYVYVKGEHLAAKPAIRQFIAVYGKAIAKGGMLEKRGLVPFGGADYDSATAQSAALAPLDPAGLK